MIIVIDNQEKKPWHFPPQFAKTVVRHLKTGDYALDGDDKFAIERKSMDDFTKTVSVGWERFSREIDRMETGLFVARCIIVEANVDNIINHEYNQPTVIPKFIFKRIAELTLRGVSVIFGGNPMACTGLAYSIFCQREEDLWNQLKQP